MKNLKFLLLGIGMCTINTQAQISYSHAWTNGTGAYADDMGKSIVVGEDNDGYVAGYFDRTVDFDPSAGFSNRTSNGRADAFISKYDEFGNLSWVRSFGGTKTDRGLAIDLDSDENVYVIGTFTGLVDFNPSLGVEYLDAGTYADIFVVKYNSSGTFLWARQISCAAAPPLPTDITIDKNKNIHISGVFSNSIDLDTDAGSTHMLYSNGGTDGFAVVLNTDGYFLKGMQIGGTGFDGIHSITVDDDLNDYLTGEIQDSVDIDPGAGILKVGADALGDCFAIKVDATSNLVWSALIEGSTLSSGRSIKLDDTGNAFVMGVYDGEVDLDPGAGTNSHTTGIYNLNTFVVKLNTAGSGVWGKVLDGANNVVGNDMAVSSDGQAFVYGEFAGTVDFDPGAGVYSLTSASGAPDIFLCKLNRFGNLHFATSYGAGNTDLGNGIALNSCTDIYMTGGFQGSVDFGPSGSPDILTSTGARFDFYVHKLKKIRCNIFGREAVSIDEDIREQKELFFLYPNPTNSIVNIVFTEEGNNEVIIYDAQMRIVYQELQQEDKTEINLESFVSGVYFVTVNNDLETQIIKVLKQ